MEIKTSKDFVAFITETMEGVRQGGISAAAGNSVANLGGKILQMISLEMKAMDYPKLSNRKVLEIEANNK